MYYQNPCLPSLTSRRKLWKSTMHCFKIWSSLVIFILLLYVTVLYMNVPLIIFFLFFYFTILLPKIFLWLQVPQGVCWFACSWPLQLLQLWEIPHAKIFWTLSIKWGNYWFALVALKFIIIWFCIYRKECIQILVRHLNIGGRPN